MKVKINEQESYDVQLKDEYSLGELASMHERIGKILKVFGKDIFAEEEDGEPQSYKNTKLTREEFIEAMKVYYSDLPRLERMRILAEKFNQHNYNSFQTKVSINKQKFNIQPEEIGLTAFPTSGEDTATDGNDSD